MVLYGLIGMGSVLAASGNEDVRAVQVLSSASHGEGLPSQYRRDFIEPAIAELRERMSPHRFEKAWETGAGVEATDMAENLIDPSA